MEIKDLVPVEWSNKRVLTTTQLAEFYGGSPKQIAQNFNNNRDRFIEGKHFLKLEGESLKAFGVYIDNIEVDGHSIEVDIPAHTRHFYLWTERGAARHAKMLSTDRAWEVYEELEDNYFNPETAETAPVAAPEPVAQKPDKARVYLFLMNDGTIQIVKIGHSKNIRTRVAEIERKTGLKVVDMYFTPEMPRQDARLVEWASQKKLFPQRVQGEFFSADFVEARAVIDYFVELTTATLPTEYLNLIADD